MSIGYGLPDPYLAAVSWVSLQLLGVFATSVCVVAVAAIGFGMLDGRVEFRRAVTTLLGCFLIFGASSIASALSGGATSLSSAPEPVDDEPPTKRAQPAPAYDPYAGAAPTVRPTSKDEMRDLSAPR